MHISICICVAQYTVILLNKLGMVKLHYAWLQEFLPHRKKLSLVIKLLTLSAKEVIALAWLIFWINLDFFLVDLRMLPLDLDP